MDEKYKITGVNLKVELIIGLSIVPFFLIFSILTIFLYNNITDVEFRNIPFYIVIGGMLLGISLGLLFAKVLGKKMNGIWRIEVKQEYLLISFKKEKWAIKLDEILKFKIYGNPNFKYVSIFTNNEVVRMRIGNNGLAPFSNAEDLKKLDVFIKQIQPFFDENYLKKDGTVNLSPVGTVKLTYLKK